MALVTAFAAVWGVVPPFAFLITALSHFGQSRSILCKLRSPCAASRRAMWSACRIASDTIVSVGLQAAPLVNWLPSEMNRFLMSWGLAEFVHHTIARLLAHSVGTHVVGAWIGRRRIGHGGADGLVDGGSLLVGVIAHRGAFSGSERSGDSACVDG